MVFTVFLLFIMCDFAPVIRYLLSIISYQLVLSLDTLLCQIYTLADY